LGQEAQRSDGECGGSDLWLTNFGLLLYTARRGKWQADFMLSGGCFFLHACAQNVRVWRSALEDTARRCIRIIAQSLPNDDGRSFLCAVGGHLAFELLRVHQVLLGRQLGCTCAAALYAAVLWRHSHYVCAHRIHAAETHRRRVKDNARAC